MSAAEKLQPDLPVKAAYSTAELAAASGLDPDALVRLLRACGIKPIGGTERKKALWLLADLKRAADGKFLASLQSVEAWRRTREQVRRERAEPERDPLEGLEDP